MVFPGTETIEPLTGRQMERPSTRVLLMRAGRHDLFLRALPHPGCADLWQEVDSECIGKHHDRMGLQGVVVQAHPGQAIDTVRVVIFGYQFGAFPRSEEHTSELSHLVISYAVFCLKKKKKKIISQHNLKKEIKKKQKTKQKQ